MLSTRCVASTAASSAATTSSSVPTLMMVGKVGLLHHILGCRHGLIRKPGLSLLLVATPALFFLYGWKRSFLVPVFAPRPMRCCSYTCINPLSNKSPPEIGTEHRLDAVDAVEEELFVEAPCGLNICSIDCCKKAALDFSAEDPS